MSLVWCVVLFALVELRGEWSIATAPPNALWFHRQLPAALPRDPQLVFRFYASHFTVFVDGRPVYQFDDDRVQDRLTIHVVPLPREGKQLSVRVTHPRGEPYFGGAPWLAARDELPDAIRAATITPLREDLGDLIAGAALFVIGLVAIAAALLIRRADTRILLWFGLFAALYGLRLLADSHLPFALGIRARSALFTAAWITYLINIPGWLLARRLVGDGWKKTLRLQIYAFAAFAPMGIAADLITGRFFSLEAVNNLLVILGGLNVLFNLLYARQWRLLETRVILIGSCLFIVLALNNNLTSLGVLPWDPISETWGFIAFVLALGFAATRNFLRGERARVALANELETAREIQRSILPTSMPELAGLRFHAHYDPASTVAGDLYDFLRVDEQRAGAIIADVSGHGIPAAIVASMVKIAVSSQSPLAHDPAALLREVNRTLRGQVRRVFVTASYLFFDLQRRRVEVANAGHPPPLLHRDGEVRELGPHGVVLGRFETTYGSESLELRAGDRIVAYTDGVTEALNARGEAFGEERLRTMIRGGADAEAIASAVREWRDEKSEADDVTLLIVDVLS
ncbi:MAG TPA: PP2C family protein-serine/threonine phosphatase [Thermoanaerobaculia bacterium]|nr:PP2C family protein-serine/threonine phosphatase [Thermoanaerobaculia bacterium]